MDLMIAMLYIRVTNFDLIKEKIVKIFFYENI